jgi:phosphate transport system protein
VVFEFFRGGDRGLDQIEREVAGMLTDGRHSFDVAMSALISEGDITDLGDEVRATDHRINQAEETVRRALVVHSAVHRGIDVSVELAYLLIVKKLERVGDQAKNLYDLAAEGVRFNRADDHDQFLAYRDQISHMFAEAADVLVHQEPAAGRDFVQRAQGLMDTFDEGVNQFIHSEVPASHAVPRALLYRYLKRIVANLSGAALAVIEPIDRSHRSNPSGSDDIDE